MAKKENQSIKETPVTKEKAKDQKALNIVCNIILIILKILLVVTIVAIAPVFIFSLITEGISIYLLVKGAPYLSFIVISTGSLLLLFSILYIFMKLVINYKVRPTIVLTTFIAGLLLSALGCLLFPRDILKCQFVKGLPDGYKYVTETYEFSNDLDLDIFYFYNFKTDDSLEDTFKLKVKRVEGNYKFKILDSNYENVDMTYAIYLTPKDIKKLSKTLYNDFLNAKYHNYLLLFMPKMEITANSEKINDIKEKNNDIIRTKEEIRDSFKEE